MDPLRVLFLCTQNSARSQIAEALLERRSGRRFVAGSAGTEPAESVHPLAVDALRRAGIEWSHRRPKGIEEIAGDESWDLVITVCDRARESCPQLAGRPVTAHWGMPDPAAAAAGGEADRKAVFWETLAILSRRIDLLCALPDDKLRRLSLAASIDELAAEEHERSHGGES
jgi:protein-tyrosine-phosphatase